MIGAALLFIAGVAFWLMSLWLRSKMLLQARDLGSEALGAALVCLAAAFLWIAVVFAWKFG